MKRYTMNPRPSHKWSIFQKQGGGILISPICHKMRCDNFIFDQNKNFTFAAATPFLSLKKHQNIDKESNIQIWRHDTWFDELICSASSSPSLIMVQKKKLNKNFVNKPSYNDLKLNSFHSMLNMIITLQRMKLKIDFIQYFLIICHIFNVLWAMGMVTNKIGMNIRI